MPQKWRKLHPSNPSFPQVPLTWEVANSANCSGQAEMTFRLARKFGKDMIQNICF